MDGTHEQRGVGNGPQHRRKSVLLSVCPFILANEFCERLAYYGLSVNLVNYLVRKMHLEPSSAAVQVSIWMGVCYTTPILGAYLADSVMGRYKTILFFSTIYVLGMTLISATALVPSLSPDPGQDPTSVQSLLLFGSLYTIALGTGGIKPCVAAFGADQFDESYARDRREKESFFNWFYFTINVGSLVGSVVVVYIQERLSLGWGLAIPASAMLLAVFFFVLGSPLYKHVAPSGSPIVRVFQVVHVALKHRRRGLHPSNPTAKDSLQEALLADDGNQEERLGVYVEEGSTDWLQAAAQRPPAVYRSKSLKWLDAAVDEVGRGGQLEPVPAHSGKYFTVQQVEEVKLVLRLLPIWITTMGYWAGYSQMMTTFVEQGVLMNNRVELPNGWVVNVPAASMFSVDTIAVVLIIPAYDAIIEPAVRRILGKKMTLLQKIGGGLVLAVCAMLTASAVEHRRLALVHQNPSSSLSILWQVPQFFLVGASEVFASVGQLEFFYDQAPDVMRSFALALQLTNVAMGSYMSGVLVISAQWLSAAVGQDWLPRDLNDGRLDLFFLFIAGAIAVNVVFFLYAALHYEYKVVPHPQAHAWPDSGAAPTHPVAPGGMPIASRPITVGDEEEADEARHMQASRSLARMPDSPPKLAPRLR